MSENKAVISKSELYDQLVKQLKSNLNGYDFTRINKAYMFADLAHSGQKRKSGEDYITHPLNTALILAQWKLDEDTIIAGLLHDVIEDGAATKKDIISDFGQDVYLLIDGVTRVSSLRLRGSTEEVFVENLRKMFLAMAKDLRVVIVKLADRLHNMRTLTAIPGEKQVKIAKETLEIYTPLAERLGMGSVSGELGDLGFQYTYPDEFEKVIDVSRRHYKKAEAAIDRMRQEILKNCAEEKIKVEIDGRKKHIYSLWRKLERPGIEWDFDRIMDIVALRVKVDTVTECYAVLGLVHTIYKPIPNFVLSDFIAQPKPNGYQSIHTRVFGPHGKPAEVQIRTFKMHEFAEHGIAAHWAYSEIKSKIPDHILKDQGFKIENSKLSWVKELADWQKEIKNSKEFLKVVKFDALKHRNFIFSPEGDVFDLPEDATPVDFAFSVHTDLGFYIKSAIVNNKIVPLNHKLKSGDVVKIIKSKNPKKPNQDWLKFTVTTVAKNKIKKSLRSSV